jgi:tRNA modification GTPase
LFIKTLLETHRSAKVLSDGARVVIVGAPNAGKSTLFNSLLSYDRAIVTSTPGTTRDSIEGALYISNYSILLVDTAGIRKARNKIELAGIKKTNNEIQNADLIYCVIDSTKKKKESIEKAGAPIIYVYNKADLLNDEHIHNIKKTREESVVISAKTKVGISRLKQKTSELLQKKFIQKNGFYITSARQQAVLKNIETILNRTLFLDTIKELELVAVDLKLAIEQFDWLLGKTTADDILNSLFSDFCVGK